jgi:diguanylate cyclase (GGDEF)-like protein
MSLRKQLSLVLSLLFTVVLVAIMWLSLAKTCSYLEQQLGVHAQDTATALAVSVEPLLGHGDLVLVESQVGTLFARGSFKHIEVIGDDRSTLARRDSPEIIQDVPRWFVASFPIQTPVGQAFIGPGEQSSGKVNVISQPTLAYQYLWTSALQWLLWLLLGSATVVGLLQVGLSFILRPLRAIERAAVDVQASRFAQMTLLPRAPELASVVVAMNLMSQRMVQMLDLETAKAQALHKQAYEDETTGLVNRRGFELRLAEFLQGAHQMTLGAVISVELDDMRLVNRAYGFAAGEHILRLVADSARAVLSDAPVRILARSNEFSFNFVVADLSHSQVTELASELRKRILMQLVDYESAQMPSTHLGVAFFHKQDTRSDIFARADLAVESARQSRRNGFFVLHDNEEENMSLGSYGWRTLLQKALLENRWRLLQQPVLSLRLGADRALLQNECMARLVDVNGTLIAASNFMPMAARHGLMPEVDQALVTLALDYLQQSTEKETILAVNICAHSMVSATFMAWFAKRLKQLRSRASQLAIEVSEFGVLRDKQAASQVRDLVRRHGGQFGIDHFGLDPQSLALLREILPDYVKLSGALMLEVATVDSARDMLQSFVKLAHALDITVIAQQVENSAQVAVLMAAKVDAGQGYLLGTPQ